MHVKFCVYRNVLRRNETAVRLFQSSLFLVALILASCASKQHRDDMYALEYWYKAGNIDEAEYLRQRNILNEVEADRRQAAAPGRIMAATAATNSLNQITHQSQMQNQMSLMQMRQQVQNSQMQEQMRSMQMQQQMEMNRPRSFSVRPTYGGGYSGMIY